MRTVREVKENVGSYLDQTRPKRQRNVSYFAFFLIVLFATFIYGKSVGAEEISKETSVLAVSAASTVEICTPDSTPTPVTKYNCNLPSNYPDPNGQNNWENLLIYCEAIETTSSKFGIDPHLTAAVIMAESSGNAKALSDAGAVGLMQVMPSDGPAGSKYSTLSNRPITADLFDPVFNIDVGVGILFNTIQNNDDVWDALFYYVGEDYAYPDKVLSIYQSLLSQ